MGSQSSSASNGKLYYVQPTEALLVTSLTGASCCTNLCSPPREGGSCRWGCRPDICSQCLLVEGQHSASIGKTSCFSTTPGCHLPFHDVPSCLKVALHQNERKTPIKLWNKSNHVIEDSVSQGCFYSRSSITASSQRGLLACKGIFLELQFPSQVLYSTSFQKNSGFAVLSLAVAFLHCDPV